MRSVDHGFYPPHRVEKFPNDPMSESNPRALSPTRAYAAATPILSSGRRGMRPSTAGPQRAAGIVEALITEAG